MSYTLGPNGQNPWEDFFLWRIIFKCLGISLNPTVLVLALFGVVAVPMGWIASESLFVGNEAIKAENPILAEIAEINRSPYEGVFRATHQTQGHLSIFGQALSGPRLVFDQVVRPFYAIFGGANQAREYLYFLVGSLWTLFVWSIVGLGIARVSLLRLTRNERGGLDDAFEFITEYAPTCLLALLMPIGLAFLICIPTFFIGLLMGSDVGAFVVGLLWFVVLILALILGILLLGLMVSWPLIVASVAAEGQNSFDAITRCFAYVFQRPVHYAGYTLVAVVFGGACWLVAVEFTDSVVRLGYWSTGWGANRIEPGRIDLFKEPNAITGYENYSKYTSYFQDSSESAESSAAESELKEFASNQDSTAVESQSLAQRASPQELKVEAADDKSSDPLSNARQLIFFWNGFAKTLASAFIHGLFWSMASAVYLLLRKDLDETEIDEIFLIEEQRTYDLPPLKSDENGIPQIQPIPEEELR